MLVFIGKLSPSAFRWVPMCHGFSDFSAFCHHFMSTKLETSSNRVNSKIYIATITYAIYTGIDDIKWNTSQVTICGTSHKWSTSINYKTNRRKLGRNWQNVISLEKWSPWRVGIFEGWPLFIKLPCVRNILPVSYWSTTFR